jgi:hypothetical protein
LGNLVKNENMHKIKNGLLTLILLGICLSSTGCQAASDLFNPDTYSWDYNKEPWEKNIRRGKAPKSKNIATDY